MKDRTFELYVETDAERGSRHVWLRLARDGSLLLEGQDLGASVTRSFGEDISEYEWAWELPPERVHVLVRLLGAPKATRDVLAEVGSRLGKLPKSRIESTFEEAGAAFWSRVAE